MILAVAVMVVSFLCGYFIAAIMYNWHSKKHSVKQVPFEKSVLVRNGAKKIVVRAIPDVTGKTIAELQAMSGGVIYYRPCSSAGWYEVSLNGNDSIGYLPAKYIKK